MREVVQFLSDSRVYFDFSSRLLHLEDGTSVSVHDYQGNLLRLFTSYPDVVIPCRQIASPELAETLPPENYQDLLSTNSDNQLALEYMHELWALNPILRKVLIAYSRFGYVYNGNKLMLVEDDWKPASIEMKEDQHAKITDQVTLLAMETEVAFPYEGEKPFVFVSYAHKNSTEVMGILNRLKGWGLRIWYDEGIEWPQAIAEHLKKCTLFLAFHSKESIVSPNCRQEVAYAIKNRKTILSVYLEDVVLPDGMDMQLTIYQAIIKRDTESEKVLSERIFNTPVIKKCMNNSIVETVHTIYRRPKPRIRVISISLFVLLILLFGFKLCFPQIVSSFKDLDTESTRSSTYEELNKQLKVAQAAYDIAEEEYNMAVEDLQRAKEAMEAYMDLQVNTSWHNRQDVWKEEYEDASVEYKYRLSIRNKKREILKEAEAALEAAKTALGNANDGE